MRYYKAYAEKHSNRQKTVKNRKYWSYSYFSKSLRIFPRNLSVTLQNRTMDVTAVLQRLTHPNRLKQHGDSLFHMLLTNVR